MQDHEDFFLRECQRFWMDLCVQMQSVKDIFHFLERTVLIREAA